MTISWVDGRTAALALLLGAFISSMPRRTLDSITSSTALQRAVLTLDISQAPEISLF